LPEAPAYFQRDAEINREGAAIIEELPALEALSSADVNKLIQRGALVLDVRSVAEFGAGHIPGSWNIGLGGQFAPWSGALIDPDQVVVLVSNGTAEIDEARVRLARVGLHNVVGYLDGGIAAWHGAKFPLDKIEQITPDIGEAIVSDTVVIDVRRAAEYFAGHLPQAKNIPLPDLLHCLTELPKDKGISVICASGYRSSIAASILQANGFETVVNLAGGTKAWESYGYQLSREEAKALPAKKN
jgi:hydroxyacylglutathione hydrolase